MITLTNESKEDTIKHRSVLSNQGIIKVKDLGRVMNQLGLFELPDYKLDAPTSAIV
jgi:hypothetical protein